MWNWKRGEISDWGVESTGFQRQIDVLSRKIKILECEEHKWVDIYDVDTRLNIVYSASVGSKWVQCKHCGKLEVMTYEKYNEFQLGYALDEVERLGGEVDRGEE